MTRAYPAQQLPLPALAEHRHLQVIASQEGRPARGPVTCQRRTGDSPALDAVERTQGVQTDRRTQPRAHETRPGHGRSADRHDPFGIQNARRELTADGDHVLIVEMPDHAHRTDRVQEMDVRADQARGVWTRELRVDEAFSVRHRHVGTETATNVYVAVRQP